jgi:hypothetical protein
VYRRFFRGKPMRLVGTILREAALEDADFCRSHFLSDHGNFSAGKLVECMPQLSPSLSKNAVLLLVVGNVRRPPT